MFRHEKNKIFANGMISDRTADNLFDYSLDNRNILRYNQNGYTRNRLDVRKTVTSHKAI